MATKQEIFDVFYSKKLTTRSGGGTAKTKMGRNYPSLEAIAALGKKAKETSNELHQYFVKIRDRNPNIAPPPRP